jgi:predicted RNA binding protein YcfA (HicA-like mRNA interferase family)
MSPRLPRISAKDLIRALKRDGWYESRQVGSHLVMKNSAKPGRRVVVPVHAGKDIRPGLLSSILEDAGMTVEDLERLL